jgi:deoxyhypusine synthase
LVFSYKIKMDDKEKYEKAREILLKDNEDLSGITVRGYEFNSGVNWEKIMKSFGSTGHQASHLWKAIGIINKMIESKAKIYFGFTSSMVSSGLRDVFRYLFEHKKIDIAVTTAGAIEEDIIKCLDDFKIGRFDVSGKELLEKGINRIGGVYAPRRGYTKFEDFIQPVLNKMYDEQNETGKVVTPSEIVWALGEAINDKRSICYWAWKNKIKIYCPAITDGALGDNVYFFKFKNSDFKIDVAEDMYELNNTTIGLEKSGVIILGAGIVKHHILNANMLRNGADFTVYINTAQEFDGSDAGAMPEEAISWGKIVPEGDMVKVFGDATILWPLIVAETFARE